MKSILASVVITTALLAVGWQVSGGDSDSDDIGLPGTPWKSSPGVAPVENELYREECSGCHMAYPPGLLPAGSWGKMMDNLDDHFGDNAELDPATQAEIAAYLMTNSADSSSYRRSRRIMRSLRSGTFPEKITAVPYIRHEHDEIPAKMIASNPEVGNLSNCNACHAGAERGVFSERAISIPGFGKWDD